MISVIIPAYNVEKYIGKCVNSVLNQTYKDYEIILVDDGSTDFTPSICDEYAEKFEKITVIHKKNGGLSSARNAGIEASRGDYLYFLDSDDYIHSECFTVMMKALTENNADIAMSGMCRIDIDGNTIDAYNSESPIRDETISSTEFMHKLAEQYGYYYCMSCNKLFRKKVFEGVRFPDGKLHEDWACIFKLAYNCKNIVILERSLYYYLIHEDSITGKPFTLSNLDRDEAFYNNILFLQKKGLYNIAEKEAFHALECCRIRLLKGIEMGLEKEVFNRIKEYCKYEYKCSKKQLKNKDTVAKITYYLIANFPRIYIFIKKL